MGVPFRSCVITCSRRRLHRPFSIEDAVVAGQRSCFLVARLEAMLPEDQWLFTAEELTNSPSRLGGMSRDEEDRCRRIGTDVIKRIAEKVQPTEMPKFAAYSAMVYFHRFFALNSFKQFDMHMMAVACLLLAGKVEECPRSVKALINAYYSVQGKRIDPTSKEAYNFKLSAVNSERVLLYTLGF